MTKKYEKLEDKQRNQTARRLAFEILHVFLVSLAVPALILLDVS